MKRLITLLIVVLIFYLFIFFMSRDTKPEFLLGTGWKLIILEDSKEYREILIGNINKDTLYFIKDLKIYPVIKGFLSYDLKEKLTKKDLDKPFSTTIKLISKNNTGNIYAKIEYEIIKGEAINYIFNLPIRIEKIEIENPVKLIETYID